jgi:hypothetical protein
MRAAPLNSVHLHLHANHLTTKWPVNCSNIFQPLSLFSSSCRDEKSDPVLFPFLHPFIHLSSTRGWDSWSWFLKRWNCYMRLPIRRHEDDACPSSLSYKFLEILPGRTFFVSFGLFEWILCYAMKIKFRIMRHYLVLLAPAKKTCIRSLFLSM